MSKLDSGTPRTPDGAPVTAAGRSLWDQVAHVAEPLDPFWITRIRAAIRAIEAEAAAPAGLDVTLMRRTLVELHRILDGERPDAAQIVAQYTRLRQEAGESKEPSHDS